MRIQRGALATALAGLLVTSAHAVLVPGDSSRTTTHGGYTRAYDVHVPPSYTGATRVPLVIDMHGFLTGKTIQAGWSGWKALSDTEGFVVVYPLGLFGQPGDPEAANGDFNDVLAGDYTTPHGPSWNAADFCCGDAFTLGIDDVGFLRHVVAEVSAEGAIDPRRIYATGLSNGGLMAHRLACEASDLFAAVAPMAAPLGFDPPTQCAPPRAVPVLTFQGVTDTVVPYAGPSTFLSAADSLQRWRDLGGCGPGAPDTTETYGPASCAIDTTCADGVQVGLCSVYATVFYGHILYFNPDVALAPRAWAFLSQFTLPGSVCGDGGIDPGEGCDDGNLVSGDCCSATCQLEAPGAPCAADASRCTADVCDGAGHCTHLMPASAGCDGASGAKLVLKKDVADPAKDKLLWKWKSAALLAKAALGTPLATTSLVLCVGDAAGNVLLDVTAPAGGLCAGTPCWTERAAGFRYKDSALDPDGIRSLTAKASAQAGKGRLAVKGAGANLATPGLPIAALPVTTRLVGSDVSSCWEATLATVRKNEAARLLLVTD